MAHFRPLARHSSPRSASAREADPARTAGRAVQVERRYAVTDIASSTNDITSEPSSNPVRSVDDLGNLSQHAAGYAGTDAPVAPAAYPTSDSIDFRADGHPDGD